MSNRAVQFIPFDAVKGYKKALREKEKIKVEKIELSSEDIEKISSTLSKIKKGTIVEIVHYFESEYIKLTGIVSKIDIIYQYLVIVKTKVKFDDILRIDIIDEAIR